ncbi:MAG: hypothetical protein Q8936_08410 [Bacillota bacterium]|nr:hypothetical protein [Bacillota bacterium]
MAMGKVYDIINKLTNNKPVIKLAEDKIYTVNNSKNTAILIKQLSEDTAIDDFERMDKIIEAAIGNEALEYINSLNLSVATIGTIINAIMAAISELDLEEVEKEAAKQAKSFRNKK